MKVVIIGAGNIAFHLTYRFIDTGISIIQIFNRNKEHAAAIGTPFHIPITNKPSEINIDGDVYIISVSDDAIVDISEKLKTFIGNKLVVHTSGAVDSHVLKSYFVNYGGFYPLQTFTRTILPDFSKIPILITSNSSENLKFLKKLALTISNAVFEENDLQRLQYHLAAVIANNFTNHLFAKAFNFLLENKLNPEVILPLIDETVRKIHQADPGSIQTGPAKRGDIHTIESHLKLLEQQSSLKKIYIDISNSINPDLKLKA